jgi:hypothetical protein
MQLLTFLTTSVVFRIICWFYWLQTCSCWHSWQHLLFSGLFVGFIDCKHADVHILDNICCFQDYLFVLWNANMQLFTFLTSSVVFRIICWFYWLQTCSCDILDNICCFQDYLFLLWTANMQLLTFLTTSVVFRIICWFYWLQTCTCDILDNICCFQDYLLVLLTANMQLLTFLTTSVVVGFIDCKHAAVDILDNICCFQDYLLVLLIANMQLLTFLTISVVFRIICWFYWLQTWSCCHSWQHLLFSGLFVGFIDCKHAAVDILDNICCVQDYLLVLLTANMQLLTFLTISVVFRIICWFYWLQTQQG